MAWKRKIRRFAVLVLTTALLPISPATGAIASLSITATPGTVQSTYGANPTASSIDINFISTAANDDFVKVSAVMGSNPAGQNVEPVLSATSNTNATVEMFSSTANVKAVAPGVVNAKFGVSLRSGSSSPLVSGTYTLLIIATPTAAPGITQTITFVITPPPTPSLSLGLSRIWLAEGATTASESNNVATINVSSTVDTKNQVANLTVDLRDTNNAPITNLPLTVSITGPGIIGIGASSSSNIAMGRAVLGQPGYYSISIYADGIFGTGTVTVSQNGQQIGSRTITFAQAAPPPASVIISNISISSLAVVAGESIKIQFNSATTSLATGQEAYVSINSYEDCDVDGCSVGGSATLISGDSSNGTWLAGLQIPSNAFSGEYTITIYFPKLKGVNGFYYRHPTRVTVKGIDPPPPLPPASASMSNITFSKTDLKIGESLVMKISVKTTSFPLGIPIQATIFTDGCEGDDGCSSAGVGKLLAGTLQDGIWEISIPIHSQLFSGKYSVNYGFFKLKGTPGAIGQQENIVTILGIDPPPPAPPISIKISDISPNVTTINAGQMLDVSFGVVSTNLNSSQVAQVYLFPVNGDDGCGEDCGLGIANLVSGSFSKGIWSTSFLIPSTIPSGNYSLRVWFPKLKGIPGFYADYKGQIKVLGSNQPAIVPYYTFSELRISTTQAKIGQTIEGYFSLKSNDDKVSYPACIMEGAGGEWAEASLVSGTTMAGNWVCKVLIPPNAITGSYRLRTAVVGYANNNKNEEWADLGTISVSGIAYVDVYYTIGATRISVSEAKVGQIIQGYFSLKTNDENVYTPECSLVGVSDWVRATKLSGTAISGSWVCTIQVPTTAVSGLATFQVVVIGPANNNKNEERVSIGSIDIQGTTPAPVLTQNECRIALASQQANLSQSLSDIAIITKYITDPETFRDFFTVNSRRWSDALTLVNSIWNKNLTRTETSFTEIRSSRIQSCGGYAEFKGVAEKYSLELESTIRLVKSQNSAISQWYSNIQAKIPDPQKYFNPQVEIGSIEIQNISEKVLGIATINFAYQANSGIAKIQCTVSDGTCLVLENGNSSSGQTYYALAEVRNFSPGSNIFLSLKQFAPSGRMVASIDEPFATLKLGLQPRISTITSILGGCTFQILNYNPAFTWFAKSEMSVSNEGIATIKTRFATDEYISTSRSGYQTVNAINTLFRCIPLSQSGTNEQDQIIEDDGVEEEPAGNLKIRKESTGKFLMTVTSNLDSEKISLLATRKGKVTIRFSAMTNESGSVKIRTSRKLSGYTVRLVFDGVTLSTTKVR
jgi:hypothetical protein